MVVVGRVRRGVLRMLRQTAPVVGRLPSRICDDSRARIALAVVGPNARAPPVAVLEVIAQEVTEVGPTVVLRINDVDQQTQWNFGRGYIERILCLVAEEHERNRVAAGLAFPIGASVEEPRILLRRAPRVLNDIFVAQA